MIKDSAVSIQDSARKKKELKADSRKLKANGRKGRKMKFRPEITRVKLNPEQAVLSCSCHNGRLWEHTEPMVYGPYQHQHNCWDWGPHGKPYIFGDYRHLPGAQGYNSGWGFRTTDGLVSS
ncbi:MAG: hypothetical protein KKD55_01785 [Candidatus Omnitrophica bacterium]|nr:hypothetical protein [Candidatus Omnitrophota bacterium]MBU1809768.1 hypothetical protein [Candidatus Omnitrophota bacterium]